MGSGPLVDGALLAGRIAGVIRVRALQALRRRGRRRVRRHPGGFRGSRCRSGWDFGHRGAGRLRRGGWVLDSLWRVRDCRRVEAALRPGRSWRHLHGGFLHAYRKVVVGGPGLLGLLELLPSFLRVAVPFCLPQELAQSLVTHSLAPRIPLAGDFYLLPGDVGETSRI